MLRHEGFDAQALRIECANAPAIARFGLAPHYVGFGKQPPGIEGDDVDGQILAQNGVRDGLVFEPEARGEHQPARDGAPRLRQPVNQIEIGKAVYQALCCCVEW